MQNLFKNVLKIKKIFIIFQKRYKHLVIAKMILENDLN